MPFTAGPAQLAFEAVPGFFKYTNPAVKNADLPAIAPDFGLEEGMTWSKLKQELRRLNEDGAADGISYKLVFAARHGQGYHNVAEEKYGTKAWDEKWSLLTGDGEAVWGPDPRLTELGRQQGSDQRAAWLQQRGRGDLGAPLPTRLFSSPFARSAETLHLAFDGILLGQGAPPDHALTPLILEGLREDFCDRHTCDQRSRRSEVQKLWGSWEIEEGMAEEDDLFKSDVHESKVQMALRLADTLGQIWSLSEGHTAINITSHSGVMQSLFRAVKHDDFKPKTGGIVPLLVKATPLEVQAKKVASSFAPGLLSQEARKRHKASYAASRPYRHAVVEALIDDQLLRRARDEIVRELSFTEKETDIYKVNQTGDLANLDGLPREEAARLESVLRVRNAIYSREFRQWLMDVTGCGPLSAKKKDMSINDYRAGCHLLNHDDVISTRRLSYILYLPDPSEPWLPEWGGALELYPIVSRGIPACKPTTVIPPRWNQYTFFAVQPGYSFHSVEEVVRPDKSRLSISGWFHRPQPDEEGYTEEDEKREEEERKDHASAENIATKKATAPFHPFPDSLAPPLPGSALSSDDARFLARFLNPAYLQPKTQAVLFERFGDDSHILLADVLRKEIASTLGKALGARDARDGLRWWERGGGRKEARIASHDTGVGADDSKWQLVGPPHRQRYVSLVAAPPRAEEQRQAVDGGAAAKPYPWLATNPAVPDPLPTDADELLALLQTHLLPSPAFRHLLANVTQLVPLGCRPVEVRRFRPGLDYTLARGDAEGAVLDVNLCLTPDSARLALDAAKAAANGGVTGPTGLASGRGRGAAAAAAKAKRAKTTTATTSATKPAGPSRKEAKEHAERWQSGELGAWEAYLAPPDEGEDPAVYQSSGGGGGRGGVAKGEETRGEDGDVAMADAAKDAKVGNANGESSHQKAHAKRDDDEEGGDDDEYEDEDDEEDDEDEDEEDFDGVLLHLEPSFNSLSVVLRDEGTMRFVKYVSATAGTSRWDVASEWEIGAVQLEEEDEGEGGGETA